MNVLSVLNNAFEIIVEAGDSLLNADALTTPLLQNIDFDSLFADVSELVDDVIADIDQIVEAATIQVTTSLDTLDIPTDVVDVSGFVTALVEAIAELPDDTTVDSLLSQLDIPFLSDDQLLDVLTDVSALIDDIAPGLRQISITPALEQGSEFIEDLSASVGTITIDGLSLSGELMSGGVLRTFTTDVSDDVNDLLENIQDFLGDVTGSARLIDGQFTGDVTVGSTEYTLDLDVTSALTSSLVNLLTTIDTPISFANGEIAVNIDTALGDIDGTIDFADGDLDFDLVTPFGDVDVSVDFPENAQFQVPLEFAGLSLDLELDLAAGVIVVPLFGGVDIPLDQLSGALSFAENGLASLSLDAGFPIPVETTFEVEPLLGIVATELLEDFSGDLTLDSGTINGTIASRFGEFPVMSSLDDLMLQATAVLDQTTGELVLDNGVAGLSLETPFGTLVGDFALTPVGDILSSIPSFVS